MAIVKFGVFMTIWVLDLQKIHLCLSILPITTFAVHFALFQNKTLIIKLIGAGGASQRDEAAKIANDFFIHNFDVFTISKSSHVA